MSHTPIDADREAAAALIEQYWRGGGEEHERMRALAADYRKGHSQGVWAAAFARHREQSTAALSAEVERLRGELERIAWHDLTWKEARDVARAALSTTSAPVADNIGGGGDLHQRAWEVLNWRKRGLLEGHALDDLAARKGWEDTGSEPSPVRRAEDFTILEALQAIVNTATQPAPCGDAVREALEKAAQEAYRVCAETRHVTLGDIVRDTILALAKHGGQEA